MGIHRSWPSAFPNSPVQCHYTVFRSDAPYAGGGWSSRRSLLKTMAMAATIWTCNKVRSLKRDLWDKPVQETALELVRWEATGWMFKDLSTAIRERPCVPLPHKATSTSRASMFGTVVLTGSSSHQEGAARQTPWYCIGNIVFVVRGRHQCS